jgi:Xaa-Pro aminopeptidase
MTHGLEHGAQDGPDVAKRNLIKIAAGITDTGMQRAREMMELAFVQNVTEAMAADEIMKAMTDDGSNPYVEAFPPIVASGNDSAEPHGNPDNDETNFILPGEVVVVDIGARYKGWIADETRTFYLGEEPPKLFVEVYSIVLEAHDLGAAAFRVGKLGKEIDAVARDFIASKGYGDNFTHCLGHGMGVYVHQPPMLCPGSNDPIMAWSDQVVTIEPGIYLEGNFGIRIEDDYAIHRTGPEQYTHTPDDLDFAVVKPPVNLTVGGPGLTTGPSGTPLISIPCLTALVFAATVGLLITFKRRGRMLRRLLLVVRGRRF